MTELSSHEQSRLLNEPPPSAVSRRLGCLLFALMCLVSLTTGTGLWLSGVRFAEWTTDLALEDLAYVWAFLLHVVTGILALGPFVLFGIGHVVRTRGHENRVAGQRGWVLLTACIAVMISGLALLRLDGIAELRHPSSRSVVYWMHVVLPVITLALYLRHRRSGPAVRWRSGVAGASVVVAIPLMLLAIQQTKLSSARTRPPPINAVEMFQPSPVRTDSGQHIEAASLNRAEYCRECHQDAHADWSMSAHHFSSFNNPAYLTAIKEARDVFKERDGNLTASRWCAGCHDPVPLFSGDFDDPAYDMVNHPTASAGITCSVCHSITDIHNTEGNASYTIEEPQHYPFSTSSNRLLRWVNHQLIKARPAFHKQTFLKEFHDTAEFCSACHKVHVPFEVSHYREFVRGQNHYDSWLLSGISGHSARSFYYPELATTNCNDCHMPLKVSSDFGARSFDSSDGLQIHSHLFPAANTALPFWNEQSNAANAHQEFLKRALRVDVFGIRHGDSLSSRLTAPLGPESPALQPGETYLLETVIRTLNVGHHFTQGTSDSNQVWLEVTAIANGQTIAVSGHRDQNERVDRGAHFVNSFVVDRDGKRIDRRNVQDLFLSLYDHQIAPGTAQVVHHRLAVPRGLSSPVTVRVRVLYRKFDEAFRRVISENLSVAGNPITSDGPLPVTVLATDTFTFGPAEEVHATSSEHEAIPDWERWNDYGIGMLLNGRATLRQATDAFRQVEQLGRVDGPLNLARTHLAAGGAEQIQLAADALNRADRYEGPAAHPWTIHWLAGRIDRELGHLETAENHFRAIMQMRSAEMSRRGFDFSRDYVVNNLLGRTIFDRALQIRGSEKSELRERRLQEAVDVFQRTLTLDSENVDAHHNLSQLFSLLGDTRTAETHRHLHARFHPDDTARGRAAAAARNRYPAANAASEAVTIYDLRAVDSQDKVD